MIGELQNVNGYITTMNRLIESCRKVPALVVRSAGEAVSKWGEETEPKALSNLNRSHWLLSRSITRKLESYRGGAKIWSMVGFSKFRQDVRDPGVYGKYHEGGYKTSVEPKFLRRAKSSTYPALVKRIDAIKRETLQTLLTETNKPSD